MKAFKRIAALAMVAILAVTALGPMALAQGGPPEVVCVPASALNPAVPHDTWSGLEITLKGGDGSGETGTVTDPYAIQAKHTYVGNVGDLFVATLRVTDTSGEMGIDHYLVEIKDGGELDVQVNVAIDEGLWRLHKDMVRETFPDGTPYGYWPYDWNTVAATGASTEAFEIQGSLPQGDPGEDPYVETVQRGLNYLLSELYSDPVGPHPTYCPMGDPDVNGNGYGLAAHGHVVYESGIALMALASSGCPDCVAATNSDNSVAQWPVIGMESAEVNFGDAGLVVPQFVKDELDLWINYIQNDMDGDDNDGGSGYTDPWDWVNVAKTGGLLCEMKFFGDTTATPRVQDAAQFIARHWGDGDHFGSNNYYAFYSVMKGFRLLGIETIDPLNDPAGFDWYGDPSDGYAQYLVGIQQDDGSWRGGHWSHHPLSSAWAILTLKKTVVQPGPVADAGPDVPSHPPVIEITFDGTGSYHRDPDRNIVQYVWDFGDGSPTAEGAIVTHAFPAFYNPDGSINWVATTKDYDVTLTVYDDSDPALSDSDTTTVHITGPPWMPVADADGPYTIHPCWLVTLDGSGSYDPGGELYPDPDHPWHGYIVSWEWDLDNDGEYDDASGEIVTWSVCDLGVHVVGLKVTNSFGESDEVDTVVNVVEPPPAIPVAFDIKPQSCPNPLNTKDKGRLPVAILGSEDLDVTQIDPTSIRLEHLSGVSPVTWALEDTATPYEPYTGKEGIYDCTEAGPDGYLDLVVMFDTQEVVAALGEVSDGDVLVLHLTGNLMPEYSGTPIAGEDVVRIVKKGKH
jgi:hypothetical protein